MKTALQFLCALALILAIVAACAGCGQTCDGDAVQVAACEITASW
jgi:hypothetical protein